MLNSEFVNACMHTCKHESTQTCTIRVGITVLNLLLLFYHFVTLVLLVNVTELLIVVAFFLTGIISEQNNLRNFLMEKKKFGFSS